MINLPKLCEQIATRELESLYVFTGGETVILSLFLEKVAAAGSATLSRIDSVSQIFSKLQNKSIFEEPTCYVIREDRDYLLQEKVWQKLLTEKAQGIHTIIFVYGQIDKRSKFYKAHADVIVEFEKLSAEVLIKYAKKETGLLDESARQLVEMSGLDYGRLMLECNKVKTLATAENIHIEQAFKNAVKENLIYQPPADVLFDFIDAVLRRKISRTYFFWGQLVEKGENPLAVIALLYNNFRSMLLIQGSGSSSNLIENTGLTAWQVKMTKDKQGAYSIGELVRALKIIRQAEKGIKTGTIDQEIAVDYLLVNLL